MLVSIAQGHSSYVVAHLSVYCISLPDAMHALRRAKTHTGKKLGGVAHLDVNKGYGLRSTVRQARLV